MQVKLLIVRIINHNILFQMLVNRGSMAVVLLNCMAYLCYLSDVMEF